MRKNKSLKRLLMLFLIIAFVINIVPFKSYAEEQDHKVVRVGWFTSSFCYYDEFGRRCGIDYEYQQKLSTYTGWTYEYVEDSWPNLLEKLKNGEIDLLSDVSYKPEREDYMYFSDLPMGTESYYIYIDADNREITPDNLDSLDGKKIGVNKGSVQEGFLKDWAEKNEVDLNIVQLTGEENESMEMVATGEIDGYAAIFTFDSEQEVMPIARIGGSDYYYAVNKDRPDLLQELNMALAEIQDEDPYLLFQK